MKFFIDQSGKIEDTAKDTILCISNGQWSTVLIKAKTKRQLQEIFRRHGQTRNYVLFTFSAGLSLLIQNNPQATRIIIDREYFGNESVIKEIILQIIKDGKNIPVIEFGHVGKTSKAHFRAKLVTGKKEKPRLVLSEKDLLKAIKKTEVGKRLKNA